MLVGDVFLEEQHAQGRAALAGAVEGRCQHVARHLFGQRRRIHDHRVQSAGLGDQRGQRSVARRQRAVDDGGRSRWSR